MATITEYKHTAESDWQPWNYTSQPGISELPENGIIRWSDPTTGAPRSLKAVELRFDSQLITPGIEVEL